MKQIKNTIINFTLLTVIVFLLFPNIALANSTGGSLVGDTCKNNYTNSDCKVADGDFLDCEQSSLPGKPMYCTCNNSGDCLKKYGDSAPFTSTWYCWPKSPASNDLKYCHNDSGDNIFPDKGIPKTTTQPYYLSKKPDGTYECLAGASPGGQPHFAGLLPCGSEASKLNDAISPSVGLPGEAGKKTTDPGKTPPPTVSAVPAVAVQTVTEEVKKLKIFKPKLEINIPQLTFSDVANNIDDEGFLHLPYIGEYISATYKVLMVVVSIVGVIMIIVVGVKITVLGGQERIAGFKKIGQVVIGLFIAWGSYSILYTINPALVNFDVLKVKYIHPQINIDPSEPDGGGGGGGGAGETKRLCDNRTACAPYCSKKNSLPSYSTLNGADPADLIDVKKWFKYHDLTPVGLTFTADALLKTPAVTALQTAGENAANKGYIIRVQSTYRSLEGQLEKYCTHFQPPVYLVDKPDNPYKPSELAWPGGSNHGAGIAIDITLLKDGSPVAGYAKKNETGPAFEDLKSIMFGAGWARLKSERWHYEYWGGTAFPDTRCNDC